MDDMITKWTRGRRGQPDWTGHYAQRPIAGVQPTWTPYAWVDRTLAGWTVSAVYLRVYDSVDYPRLRDAKEAAEDGLREHLDEYQRRVASGVGRSLSA